jgi:CDP-glucose 4,6-dehydratase
VGLGTGALEGVEVSGWHGRNVLVTGATGLVGSWLVPRLIASGACASVLVRDWDPESELIRSGTVARCRVVSGRLEEIADIERALVEHEIDTLVHLGAQTLVGTALKSPLATFEANVRGTYNLLEACRRQAAGVRRILIASSDKAYGTSPVLPYTEEMPLRGEHPYDVSKSCTDLLARCYAVTYGLPVAVARCGNIYGGGDLNWSRIVPGTIRSVLRGERPVLRSDGTYVRDYLYVEDVVDAYLLLADGADRGGVKGEAFNFSPERPLTVFEITQALLGLLERADLPPVVLDDARAEIHDQFLDSAKARRVLDWAPRWSLPEGLRATIAWYRAFLGAQP